MSDSPDSIGGTNVEQHPHGYSIQIDRLHYTIKEDNMTGSELRQIPDPDIPQDRDLFEVVPGHPDRKIELTDQVRIVNGKRFFTAPAHINPGKINR